MQGSGLLEGCVSLSRVKQVLLAQAEAEKIRKIGEAEAFVIEAIGMAEAERMKLKAEALQQYGEAAQLALVLDALPEVRREQHSLAPGGSQAGPGLLWCVGSFAQQADEQLLHSAHATLLPCFSRSLPKWLLPSPKWMRSLSSVERTTPRCRR